MATAPGDITVKLHVDSDQIDRAIDRICTAARERGVEVKLNITVGNGMSQEAFQREVEKAMLQLSYRRR